MRRHARQRGFSLIISVAIVALLSFLGVMVMNSAYLDTELARADRSANDAFYLAETGLSWGISALDGLPYNLSGATPDRDRVTDGTPVAEADACPEGTDSCAALAWYRLDADAASSDEWVSYGNGRYRVIAALDELNASDGCWRIYLRSLGQTVDGAQRLLEVVIGPETSLCGGGG